MAGPGRVETNPSRSVSTEPLEQPSAPPSRPSQTQHWPTTREAFSERSSALSTPTPLGSSDSPAVSVDQLTREVSATQKSGNDLRAALREPLRALAKQNPDGEVRDAAFSFGTFEGAMQSDRALKALGRWALSVARS